MTDCLLRMQYWPIRTFAKSPRIILSPIMIFFPFKIIFCDPQRVDWRLTLFPVCLQGEILQYN